MSFWHRVEPSTVDTDVEEGVQARVADPLWLLARQWQMGEFKGEDAASPIKASLRAWSNGIDTFRNDVAEGGVVEDFADGRPLETRVEAESVLDGPAAVALAAEAGTQFLRRLALAGLPATRAADWSGTFGFDLAAEGIDVDALPPRPARRLALLARRGVDGRALHAAAVTAIEALATVAERADAVAVWDAWKLEYAGRFSEPGDSGESWVDERLEYTFSLGSRTGSGEVVLAADEYPGGRLDWHHFRVDAEATHGLSRRTATRTDLEVLPQPATFRGAPVPRWWEFEDRSVYFGNLAAGPADVARLVVAEFAAVFSDDWFVVPLTLPTSSLNRVGWVDVVDVFGGTTRLRSTAAEDFDQYGAERPFRYFELEGDDSASEGRTPWLLLPPVLADSQNGKPVERVGFVRDEAANLGWAIEGTIEAPTGEPMARRSLWERPEEAPVQDGVWRYRMQTTVPPWWIPLVPEPTGVGAQVRLRRARLPSWDELETPLIGAQGRVVGVPGALRFEEEEIPRGGVVVTRAWQRARGSDGAVHVWMGRRKRPGRGDRGSGLRFDTIERVASE